MRTSDDVDDIFPSALYFISMFPQAHDIPPNFVRCRELSVKEWARSLKPEWENREAGVVFGHIMKPRGLVAWLSRRLGMAATGGLSNMGLWMAAGQWDELDNLLGADAVGYLNPVFEWVNVQIVEGLEVEDVQEDGFGRQATAGQPIEDLLNCPVRRFMHGEMPRA
jgi:hypothetical protein